MPPERRPRSFNKHGEMVNHRLSFYHIWRLRQPPQRVGPQRKVPRGRDRSWLAALPCDWQVPLSGCAGSSGCWHSPKVRTALTDNGDVSVAWPRTSSLRSGNGHSEGAKPNWTVILDLFCWDLLYFKRASSSRSPSWRNGREATVPLRAERQGARFLRGGADRNGKETQDNWRGCCFSRLRRRNWCVRAHREPGREGWRSVRQWPGQRVCKRGLP